MNFYLNEFIEEKFGDKKGKLLDLGAGDFGDVEHMKSKGWFCEGVDKNMGIDLNNIYLSDNAPFDIVCSNYVMHFLKNKEALVETAYKNLREGGWFFLHTFHKDDGNMKKSLTCVEVEKMLDKYFSNVSLKELNIYDDEPGHNHWHKVIQANAQ